MSSVRRPLWPTLRIGLIDHIFIQRNATNEINLVVITFCYQKKIEFCHNYNYTVLSNII